jgi:parallel beta-helix repeat protein
MNQGLLRWVATNGLGLSLFFLLQSQIVAAGPTYYVDVVNGDDTYSPSQAQNPATPWQSIQKAVDTGGLINITKKGVPLDGYTVIVQPGTYYESVESKRDGLPGSPVILRAATPGTVIIRPPANGIGIYIQHHHHWVDGFVVTGTGVGIKMGPHRVADWIVGLVARNNKVYGNTSDGIQFRFGMGGIAEFNTVYNNGQSGLKYSGNEGKIHDNVAYLNGDFGIYVRDGVGHQVWNNRAYDNGKANLQILGSTIPPPGGRTFYVGAATGNDAYDEVQAQNPTTPWKTTRRALLIANPGDVVILLPGVYAETVASIRDGTANAPITIKALEGGYVTIQPPSGNPGVLIGHHYHVVEGLSVTGGTVGLQIGPYKKTDGPVEGVVARENHIYRNGIGIKFEATQSSAMHNIIRENGQDGILWGKRAKDGAYIFNNLVYANGQSSSAFAITIATGRDHVIMNNTVYGNQNGGIRLGSSADDPVYSQVLNNIVGKNPVGIKEPGGEYYVGRALLDYNDVYQNTVRNYDLSGGGRTKVGPNSISRDPLFLAPATGDFRLSRRDAGQAADSPVIDRGSDTAEAVGLDGRTAFTDKHPDTGRVDLGYHDTLLHPTVGTLTVDQASVTLDTNGASLALSANFRAGATSDGIELGTEYVEVGFGGYQFFLAAADFQQVGAKWVYGGAGVVSQATLEELPDKSISVTLQASGLVIETQISTNTPIEVKIGDDFGSTAVPLRGVLQFP